MTFTDDFFVLENLLLERLQGKIPEAIVLLAAELEGVKESVQPTPAIHLLYQGYRPAADPRGDIIEQTWWAIAVVRNVNQAAIRSGSAMREMAGPLLASTINALRHWSPLPGQIDPLAMAAPPGAIYQGGFLYAPTAWMAKLLYPKERR